MASKIKGMGKTKSKLIEEVLGVVHLIGILL
ncbi:hypothetical protein CHY_0327 [Carboxydothermus hydrogenoformans Z-2901]|uniref:Uncharacterized protein n=1 Tax=Carboxydothermus hydrogenoformans (strain ATCC BAA-161 / DSM 6008 / Z-2901) TaxID=246194 RepID=Q3AF94_CARHZ|nr:hypothetical protein CHY_0327 [Carboxydothermus hydrogenoformans Z-2901]